MAVRHAAMLQPEELEFDALLHSLSDPRFYPHRPRSVEVRETHASVVFLAGPLAYKLRKPVRLPFLDYSSPERRRACAEMEVWLNRRLAPDIYRGVRAVARGPGRRLRLVQDDAAGVVDWLVEMRRFDEERTMAALLARDALTMEDVTRVAERLSDFHACAQRVPEEPRAAVARERGAAEESLDELDRLLDSDDRRPRTGRRFLATALQAFGPRLEDRAGRGLVRDGHGDLRAGHVLVGDRIDVVDCIEFDHRLRHLDVGADLAFLTMDLTAHGAPAHARGLATAYRAAGGDPGDDALLAFFGVPRAWVRAKVALLEQRTDEAEQMLATADRLRWHARGPIVLCVGGVAASGKSTLAAAIQQVCAAPVLSSDVVRKQRAGLAAAARAPESLYDPAISRAVYRGLGSAAKEAAGRAGVVVVDATFRHAEDRAAFRDGLAGAAARLRFVECTAPDAVLAARARDRMKRSERVSDADADIARVQRLEWEAVTDLGQRLELRTDRPLDVQVGELDAHLDRLWTTT